MSGGTMTVTPLAQQLLGVLSPLVTSSAQDADLTSLLANVAGAHQLGTLDPAQLQHLQAQLSRLYDEFADAIASGSEFHLRRARQRFGKALSLVEKEAQAIRLEETPMAGAEVERPLSPLADSTPVVLVSELLVLGTRAVGHRVQPVQAQVAEVAVAHAR